MDESPAVKVDVSNETGGLADSASWLRLGYRAFAALPPPVKVASPS
jgi:hypothetical protein